MIIYPRDYFKNVTEITIDYLKEHNIKGLILDVDNTLIDYDKYLADEIVEWIDTLKQNHIGMYIVSNSNKKKKVEEVASKLGLEYIYFAKKPFKGGFKKAKEKLGYKAEEIATVGDQIFTDVLGGNWMGMYSILVEPIDSRDIWITIFKRPVENSIKKLYLRTKEEK